MTATTADRDDAREAYDALAPVYDLLTGDYPHELWLHRLEILARAHGLSGRRVLDVACGTGASFLPLLSRGYEVTACDVSEAMTARAREKAPGVALHVADMRDLRVLGAFDLITCLDDALNYLTTEAELESALRGFRANLAPRGLAVWDLNTLAQYRGQFATDRIVSSAKAFVGWSAGANRARIEPGAMIEVALEIFVAVDGDSWRHSTSRHRQRHWPEARLRRIAAAAGLEIVDVRGQRPGAVIDRSLDERVHTKALYVARILKGGEMIGGL